MEKFTDLSNDCIIDLRDEFDDEVECGWWADGYGSGYGWGDGDGKGCGNSTLYREYLYCVNRQLPVTAGGTWIDRCLFR